jgi:hypothetical protein
VTGVDFLSLLRKKSTTRGKSLKPQPSNVRRGYVFVFFELAEHRFEKTNKRREA